MSVKLAKISKITYFGRDKTYNLTMRSDQHNYLTVPSSGQPIHKNSHSCAYILVAYWCAWLKAHFAPEWWAAVMSGCHSDRIPKYMNTARLENVQFGEIDPNNLTKEFSVSSDLKVTPGLTSIKGIGDKAADKLVGSNEFTNIEGFVNHFGKSKSVMEPLIKLGSFRKFHKNIKATWIWYQYKYCTGKDMTILRNDIKARLNSDWTEDRIKKERERRVSEYRSLYPNRKKIPAAVYNWKPPAPNDDIDAVSKLFPDDFTLKERLEFEKQYLGYYWHSPLDIYDTSGCSDILKIKEDGGGMMACIVNSLEQAKTKDNNVMGRLKVTDGLSDATIILWSKQFNAFKQILTNDVGIKLEVKYDRARNSFTLMNSFTIPAILELKPEYK